MDLHIQDIQQTASSGRPVLSKSYQRLTPDPRLPSNPTERIRVSSIQPKPCISYVTVCMNSPISFSPPDILVYVT